MKGSVLDIVFSFVVIMILAISSIFVYIFISNAHEAFQDNPTIPDRAVSVLQSGVEFFQFMDYIVIFVLGAALVITLIAGAGIRAHPIFFVGAFLFLIVMLILTAEFTNMFLTFAETASVVEYAADYPLTIQFYQNAPLFMLVYFALLVIVIYTFGRDSGYVSY